MSDRPLAPMLPHDAAGLLEHDGDMPSVRAGERWNPRVPIELLDDHPANPSARLEHLGELIASISEKGVVTPLLITPRGERFQVLAGHRRKHSSIRAGLTLVPAVIRDTTEQEALELLLLENLQREGLKPSEEARGLRALLNTGLSQHEVARRLSKPQGHISKRVALLVLPDNVLAQIDSGGISLGDAAELVKLSAYPQRMKIALKEKGGPVYGDLAYRAAFQLRQIEIEEKDAELVATYRAKGVAIIKSTSRHQAIPKEPGMVIGKNWGCLDVDKRKHAKEPCHAVIIASGDAIECCTDPKRHPESKPKRIVSPEDELLRKERKAERDAAKERRALHAHLVKRGVGLERLATAHTILSAPIERLLEVATLLDIEVPPIPKEHQKRYDAHHKIRQILIEHAKHLAGAQRILGALVLVALEHGLEHGRGDLIEEYFGLLKVVGYNLSKVEQKLLKRHA